MTAIHFTTPTSTWQEFGFPTPPTRDYPSGHSVHGGAAAKVLQAVFNTDTIAFTASSNGAPGVRRNYASLS